MKLLDKILEKFVFSLLIFITLLVSLQVFYRYVLNSPLSWPEEITRLSVVWLVFIGGYLAYSESQHISFDLFVKKFSPPVKRFLRVLCDLGIIFFCVILVVYGWKFVVKFSGQGLPYTGLSIGLFGYLPIPIFALFTLLKTLLDIFSRKGDRDL